ncbi:MAG: protein-disulfide reductase DsbD domain-containing protein [Pacificimonas sp.]
MTAMLRFLSLTSFFVMLAGPALAQADVQNPNTRVELQAGPERDGTRTLAIVMTPRDGWHTYWKNPGAAGVETQAEWTLPGDADAGDIRYPVPSRFVVSGIMNYVFEGESALLVDVAGLPSGGERTVDLQLDYLVCDDSICVPESAALRAEMNDIAVGADRIARYAARLPTDDGAIGSFERSDDMLRLSVDVPNADELSDAYFFPLPDGALDYNAPQAISVDGDRLIIETLPGFDAALAELSGILKLIRSDGDAIGMAVTLASGEVAAGGAALPVGDDTSGNDVGGVSAVTAFALALLGGLLLNVMPCVFPILSLKALSLAKGGASPKAARTEAIFYTLGVVATVLALGAALLGLRAGGASIGWAFQLQDPRVVAFLLLLVTAIALNLAGLYELPSLSLDGGGRVASTGRSGSFFTGVLAAVVATPCTGPFMGAALGAALVLSGPAALAIFLGLGMGLALPFLLIGFIPALRNRLPKPGAWMQTMRRILSIPMFLTALALAWVLGRQAGVDGLAIGLGGALLLGLALWWLGGSGRRIAPLGLALASLAILFFVPQQTETAHAQIASDLPETRDFSPEALASLRADSTPTFLYFTADWCITCKVNEKGALSDSEVAQAFTDAGITTLVGDWTRADPVITDFLAAHGRAGVPLYLYYAPGAEARILPQLLSSDMLTALAYGEETV